MNPYALNLFALLVALAGQAFACGLASVLLLRQSPAAGRLRHIQMALAAGAGLLALQHAHSLELALHTGLYDLHQAVLAAGAAIFMALAVYGVRRPA